MTEVRCPICDRLMQGKEAAQWPHFPFCSQRCRLIDLGRWLGEDYRITAERTEENESEPRDANPESP